MFEMSSTKKWPPFDSALNFFEFICNGSSLNNAFFFVSRDALSAENYVINLLGMLLLCFGLGVGYVVTCGPFARPAEDNYEALGKWVQHNTENSGKHADRPGSSWWLQMSCVKWAPGHQQSPCHPILTMVSYENYRTIATKRNMVVQVLDVGISSVST